MSVVETTRALMASFERSAWLDMHVRVNGEEIFLAKPGGMANPMRAAPAATAPAPAPAAPAITVQITAPHVATLIGHPPAGTHVRAGETVATIELLGERIELPAPEDGTLVASAVRAGSLVDYGQTLLSLSPA